MPEPTVTPNSRPTTPTPPTPPTPPAPPRPTPPAPPKASSGSLEDIFKASGGKLDEAKKAMAEYKKTFNGSIPDQIYSNWVDAYFPGRAFGLELARQWSK